MPDDSKCFSNLTKNNSMTSSEVVTTRRKKISVGLEEVPEISFQSLFVPLAGPLFFIFGTVFVSAFIFCSRFCTRKGYDVTMQQSQGQALGTKYGTNLYGRFLQKCYQVRCFWIQDVAAPCLFNFF